MRIQQLLQLFVVLFVCSIHAHGQATDGNITGAVYDSSGAAIAGAGVELLNVATGVKAAASTDTQGVYRFGNVLVGRYTITVAAAGFTSASLKDVTVELNRTTTANVTLNVGNVSTAVEVTEFITIPLPRRYSPNHAMNSVTSPAVSFVGMTSSNFK